MTVGPADGTVPATSLAGAWRYAVEVTNPPPRTPSALYNALISPWTAYPVAGVLWYQGESNVGNAPRYRILLHGMFFGMARGVAPSRYALRDRAVAEPLAAITRSC